MDDLYDNLDNFNEEATISELQAENKQLKCKLKEYSSTLDELQKDFDKLNSEYKKLELNYSSLLKTAKAEIERKTQIISDLNKEKDKMVIWSFQNKRTAPFTKSRTYDKPISAQNYNKGREFKSDGNNKIKEIEDNKKQSPPIAIERKEQDYLTVKETTASPRTDIRSNLLNMANSDLKQGDPKIKNSDVKESILQPQKENDIFKPRALISNRRKSMPAVSLEIDNFSIDDDDDLAKAAKVCFRETTDRRRVDCNSNDKQRSKISDSSSLEDRNSGCHESSYNQKSRYSRHDVDKIDRHRLRDKSSHRYRRQSPDKYQRGSKEFHDYTYHRSEYDRHRAKKRVLESPPKDKYHWRPSREQHQTNYERKHPRERLEHRSQERYPMKHKIQHNYDESDSKRMKVEPNYRQHEDHRLQEEREFMEKKYSTQTFDIQFSSCESPDYNHPDVSTHQIREIKLTATAKLDDPRINNTKYVLKKNNGKVALSTAEGRNVEMIPVNKIAWGIKPVSMPEALVRRPFEGEQSINEICVDRENPVANIFTEPGEILDLESLDSQNIPDAILNKSKISKSDTKEIPVAKGDETKDNDNSLQKINSYKIPKLKKTIDEKQSCRKTKEINPFVKSVHENTTCKSKNSDMAIKNIDKNKQFTKPAKEITILDVETQDFFIQSNNELPNLGSSVLYDEQKYLTGKDVVEGDLELSDDNCDNIENSNQTTRIAFTQLEKKKTDKDQSSKNDAIKQSTNSSERVAVEPCKNKTTNDNNENSNQTTTTAFTQLEKKKMDKDQSSKNGTIKQSTNSSERVAVEPCKNKTTDDVKKTKNKKKPKHKEIKEEFKSKDSVQVSEKTTRKKEKEKEIKTVQIKTTFSELFDDSSSLISPEDLGLATVSVVPTSQQPDKCVPLFEDALDAADLNAIKTAKDFIPLEKSHVQASKQSSDSTNKPKIDIASTANIEPMDRAMDIKQPAISDEVTENMYKNIEPDVPEKAKNVVKTIIISTGVQPEIVNEREKQDTNVQPQIEVQSEKQIHANKIEQVSVASQEVALKALATSTPHKICLSSLDKCNIEAKLPNTSCNSVENVSRVATVENTSALDNSNTLDSQANDADVPDVRIFVRRRRKLIKK